MFCQSTPLKQWLIALKGKQSDSEDLPLLLTSSDLKVPKEHGGFLLQAQDIHFARIVPQIQHRDAAARAHQQAALGCLTRC